MGTYESYETTGIVKVAVDNAIEEVSGVLGERMDDVEDDGWTP